MIKNFSKYLKQAGTNPNKLDLSALRHHALAWMENWLRDLEKIKNNFFYRITIPVVAGRRGDNVKNWSLYSQFKIYIEKISIDHFINELDNCFIKLNKFFQKEAEEYLASRPIPEGEVCYPFPQYEKNNGVKIICRIRIQKIPTQFREEERSDAGTKDKAGYNYISTHTADAQAWLQPIPTTLNINSAYFQIFDLKSPHAETLWMIKYGKLVVQHLKENKWENPFYSDDFPLSYLVGNRVEFIVSSSCCDPCQNHFIMLRKLFDINGINLPIIIFSNRHFNDGEPDCCIFTVNDKYEYIKLPAQWDGKLRKTEPPLTAHPSLTSTNLSEEYRAVLALSVFGEALITQLTFMKPNATFMFLESLFDPQSSNFFMSDWARHFLDKILTASSFDFSNSSAKRNLEDRNQRQIIDQRFLSEYNTIPQIAEYAENLARLTTQKPDNIAGFFLLLCKQWNNFIIEFLTNGQKKELSELDVSPEILEIAQATKAATSWNIDSAPNTIKRTHTFFGETHTYICNKSLDAFLRLVRSTGSCLHFLNIAPEYQRNILNALFTHPMNSPLNSLSGIKNEDFNDQQISIFIEITLQSIKKIAFREGQWDIVMIENIFAAFQNKEFYPELLAAIDEGFKQWKNRQIPVLSRIFSIEQARDGDKMWPLTLPVSDLNNTSNEQSLGPR